MTITEPEVRPAPLSEPSPLHDLFVRAHEILRTRGWYQGGISPRPFDVTAPVCLYGSFLAAVHPRGFARVSSNNDDDLLADAALRCMERVIRQDMGWNVRIGCGIGVWNDDRSRTIDEVLEAVTIAAESTR